MRSFNETEEKRICELYQQEGQTLTFIRQMFHCRTEAIKNVLFKYNIPIKKKGCKKNRRLVENFFENIDTEEKAYLLGLYFTDGCVREDKSGKRNPLISMSLKISDIAMIQKIKEILNVEGKIQYDKREGKEAAIICFRNEKMALDLKKYGIIPQKTYKTEHLPTIEKTFLKHFLRGCIDGDGSIYLRGDKKNWTIDFCSYHYSICEDFQKYINIFLDKPNTNKIANYGTAYHIHFYDQQQVKQIAELLYKDNKISLARKNSLAERIFLEDNK